MSETKRLIEKERPEKIEERHEDEDGGHGTGESTAATTSGSAVRSKIRRRQSPPYGGTDYGSSASKYGTLDTSAGMKRSLLVDTYPRTHITRKQFAIAFIAFLIFAAAVGVTLILGLPRLDAKRTEYYAAKFYESPVQQEPFHQRSVVVKGSQECSRIGESILTRGNGTAMDAALAALYCSLVASPHLVRFDSALTGLYYSNFTATAFSSAFQNIPMPSSNDSLSWPSLIEATRLLSSRFGRAQWANIVNPSVQLATSGAPVSKGLSSFLQAKEHGDLLKQNTTLTNLFSKEVNNSTRAFLGEGDLLRVPGLAETLTLLAQSNGTSQLLEMNKTLQRRLEDDLNITMSPTVSNTTTASSELLQTEVPLSISLLNETLTLLTAPQPALGVALSQILAILDRIILSNQSFIELCNDDNRTLKEGAFEFHYIIEALKFGAATRASLASGSNSTKIASFLDKNKLQEIATKILDFSVYPEAVHSNEYYGFPEVDLVANKESSSVGGLEILVYDGITGESVSLEVINQNGLFDGTKIVSETTGIILNKVKNEHINDQETYSATPVFVVDSATKKIRLASSASGPESISALSQVLYKIFYNCQELKSATDESRFYYSPENQIVQYESTFPQAYIDLLIKLFGHYNLKSVKVDGKRSSVSSIMHLQTSRTLSAQSNSTQTQVEELNEVMTMTDYRSGSAYADGD